MFEAYGTVKDLGKDAVQTELYARFRFGQEVAPKDRKAIKDRIKRIPDYLGSAENLGRYKENALMGDYYGSCDSYKQTYLRKCIFRLGFNLRVEETKASSVKLEDMLDLEALNHFILTGENKKDRGK